MSDISLEIGKRLEKIRTDVGLQKKDFAEKLDITANAYTNYIKETRLIPTDLCIKINQLFNVSLNWLLLGQGLMYMNSKKEVRGDAKLLDMIFDCLEDMTDESKEKIYHYCRIEELNKK